MLPLASKYVSKFKTSTNKNAIKSTESRLQTILFLLMTASSRHLDFPISDDTNKIHFNKRDKVSSFKITYMP